MGEGHASQTQRKQERKVKAPRKNVEEWKQVKLRSKS